VAKVRVRLAVSKQRLQRFHVERFNLKKYHVEIPNSTWETMKENMKISTKRSIHYYDLKKHRPWFNKECSKLLDQRKQARLQWLQHPSELSGDMNNLRHGARRYFRNKKINLINLRQATNLEVT
jgi:hypothetical protein